MTTVCSPPLDSSLHVQSTRNVTGGDEVRVTCTEFGHRLVGDNSTLFCNATSQTWDIASPSCQWTWEFTTHEKVVLGTAVGCAAFILVVVLVTLIVCCCRRWRQREDKEYNDLMYGDNPGYSASPGDTGGVYPDAYFAYQDTGNKHDSNGIAGTMDRAWLGYIPRPKVAEGRYYQS